MRREVFEFLFGRIIFRVQFIKVSFIELSRDRLVDIGDRGVIPEFGVFLCGIETIDLSGADDDIRSVNHIENDDVDPRCMPYPTRVPGDHVKGTLKMLGKYPSKC